MKYTKCLLCLIVVALILASSTVNAQQTAYFDSSVISAKNKPQQNEFWNNTYNFPAKPRNKWELGASLGMLTISGDVPAILPTLGFEAHVRKALGYIFSLRLQYMNGNAKGLMWQPSAVNTRNSAWLDNGVPALAVGNLPLGKGYNAVYLDEFGVRRALSPTLNGGNAELIYHNYKTHIQDLSLQGLITLNNIRFHKQKTKLTIYGGAGIGITAYHVMVNALGANGENYSKLFNEVAYSTRNGGDGNLGDKKEIWKRLRDGYNGIPGMDNTYETEGESEGKRRGTLGKNTVRPSGTVLVGLSYHLGSRINIALENRHTFVKTDLLDGQQWQVHPLGDVVMTRDYDSYNFASLGVNFNFGAKSVEPLWWLNPLDYAYSDLSNPKHMKLPKPVFDDADGDGVLDQLDRELNTPAGCPVDAHGVTADTDGDGVPDCKDKQLITPNECQPVDADGVGKCPTPECCIDINKSLTDPKNQNKLSSTNCPYDYPSIRMKGISLSKDNKAMLESIALKLKDNPECKITITAYPKANKRLQAIADKKNESIKNYLIEKLGISADRITTNIVIDGGDADTIDIK